MTSFKEEIENARGSEEEAHIKKSYAFENAVEQLNRELDAKVEKHFGLTHTEKMTIILSIEPYDEETTREYIEDKTDGFRFNTPFGECELRLATYIAHGVAEYSYYEI